VQLKNDIESRNILDDTICEFYKKNGSRIARRFLHSQDEQWNCLYSHFLIDRKHVIRYGILQDRGFWSGGVELAIGPHYFPPSAFWSYENSERFAMEATTSGVEQNLALLDEFWNLGAK
jgi:hypothetical protein